MSEIADRIVTFEPLERGDNPNADALVAFRIEPPINVHNPDFLSEAVEGLGWENKHGAFPIISDAKVNYSDDQGTHGIVRVNAYTEPGIFQSLIERSFVPALSLGKKTVQLAFKTDAL